MFLKLDGTFWIQLANFAIFFALLNVLFLKPVGEAIRKRREYINSVVNDYDSYQAQANALRAAAEKVRAEARREAEQQLTKARGEASNRSAELSAQYAQRVTETVEEAQRKAAAEYDAAKAGEEKRVQQLAGIMVERATTGAVTL